MLPELHKITSVPPRLSEARDATSWWALSVLPVDRLFLVGFACVTNEERKQALFPNVALRLLLARVVTPCL